MFTADEISTAKVSIDHVHCTEKAKAAGLWFRASPEREGYREGWRVTDRQRVKNNWSLELDLVKWLDCNGQCI